MNAAYSSCVRYFKKILKSRKNVKVTTLIGNWMKSLIMRNVKDEFLQLFEKMIESDLIAVHKYIHREEVS